MYKAKVLVSIDGEERATLCDTGCERTCVSERFLRRHPKLYDSVVQPFVGNTISIDGSKVETTGILNIPFRINGRHLRMSCRIVRNLVYDFILGWDFFSKYKCSIHPSEGHLKLQNDIVNLIPNSIDVTSSHFSLVEDAVIPPLSKMITQAAYFLNPADKITPSDYPLGSARWRGNWGMLQLDGLFLELTTDHSRLNWSTRLTHQSPSEQTMSWGMSLSPMMKRLTCALKRPTLSYPTEVMTRGTNRKKDALVKPHPPPRLKTPLNQQTLWKPCPHPRKPHPSHQLTTPQ